MNYAVALAAVALCVILFIHGSKGQTADVDAPDIVPGSDDGFEPVTLDTMRAALKRAAERYGVDIARNVERIYRLESGGLNNVLLQRTNAPGMQALASSWPFGWKRRGTDPSMFAPVVRMRENNPATGIPQGAEVAFVAFNRIDTAVDYLAQFLREYGNNAGRWKSTDPVLQKRYRDALANIPTSWTDSTL